MCCLQQNVKGDHQVEQLTEKLTAGDVHEEPMVAQSYKESKDSQQQQFSGDQLPLLPIIPETGMSHL